MKHNSVPLLVLVLCSLNGGCKPDEGVTPADDTYIPLVTNSWIDTVRPEHKFNLTGSPPNVSTGKVGGEETINDIVVSDTLFGSFSNRNITFTVRRGGRDTTYSGRYTADTLIDLGRLKLFRFGQ